MNRSLEETSFPYLWIATRFGVPYSEVLASADRPGDLRGDWNDLWKLQVMKIVKKNAKPA